MRDNKYKMKKETSTPLEVVIKKVIASGDKTELENLKNQLKQEFFDVFGEQVSVYECYKKYFQTK